MITKDSSEFLGRADNLGALLRYRAFNHRELLMDPSRQHPRWGHAAKMPTMLNAPTPFLDPADRPAVPGAAGLAGCTS